MVLRGILRHWDRADIRHGLLKLLQCLGQLRNLLLRLLNNLLTLHRVLRLTCGLFGLLIDGLNLLLKLGNLRIRYGRLHECFLRGIHGTQKIIPSGNLQA